MKLVMMGPPGAGKGTQAERFAREHGVPKISTGEILREAVAAGTEMGKAVKAVMEHGGLVGDDLIIGIVRERLAQPDAQAGYVLDGFPRTVPQARVLDSVIDGSCPLVIVEIQVPDDELVRRVRLRRICARCGTAASAFGSVGTAVCRECGGALVQRSDDTEDVIRERLKVYWRETRPMIAYYHERPTYRVVNGALAPEKVRDALVTAVASAMGRDPGAQSA
ncbi:MAG: adenylate kinase [Acidobacteria bacterium]|nr:adenylate kinase [Acidobacteriota bacterium]